MVKESSQKMIWFLFLDLQCIITDIKEKLQKKFLESNFLKPFLGLTGQIAFDQKTIVETYIDIAVITDSEVDKKYINSDRDYQMRILLSNKTKIELQNIVTDQDQFILISGVPGIGKSTLVKKIILEWKEERLSGNVE